MTRQQAIRIGIVLYAVAGIGLAIFGVLTWGIPGESQTGMYAGGYDESPAARGVPFWQHLKNELIGNGAPPSKGHDRQ
jgi:hypothetical protein